MTEGLLTLFDADLSANVRWHPGFKRVLRDKKSEYVVLESKILSARPGHRPAWRCASCETVVIPGTPAPSKEVSQDGLAHP